MGDDNLERTLDQFDELWQDDEDDELWQDDEDVSDSASADSSSSDMSLIHSLQADMRSSFGRFPTPAKESRREEKEQPPLDNTSRHSQEANGPVVTGIEYQVAWNRLVACMIRSLISKERVLASERLQGLPPSPAIITSNHSRMTVLKARGFKSDED